MSIAHGPEVKTEKLYMLICSLRKDGWPARYWGPIEGQFLDLLINSWRLLKVKTSLKDRQRLEVYFLSSDSQNEFIKCCISKVASEPNQFHCLTVAQLRFLTRVVTRLRTESFVPCSLILC